MEKMYHVGFDDTHGAKYVILPGDPGRVEKIAQFLDEPHFYCQHREYTTWLGKVDGETVMVMSTGMGGPSTAIGVEECYKTGVRTFIRIGTTGGINLKVMGGDLVIANSAIRMEGTTREYMPIEFPAVADHDVTCALIQAAKNLGARWHVGTVQCKDAFYGQHEPERLPVGPMLSISGNAGKRAAPSPARWSRRHCMWSAPHWRKPVPAASSMSAGTRSARSWACPTPSSMIRRWPARPPWKRFVCSSSRTEKLPSASNGTREP